MGTLLGIGLSNALAAAVLAPVVAGVARGLGRRPALAHGLWLLVLLKLVTPPLFTVEVPLPAAGRAEAGAEAGGVGGEAGRGADSGGGVRDVDGEEGWGPIDVGTMPAEGVEVETSAPAKVVEAGRETATAVRMPVGARSWFLSWSWEGVVGGVWLAGSAAWVGLAAVRIARFRRAIRGAEPAPGEVTGRVAELAAQIGLRRGPEVVLVPGPVSPLVWALVGRARLVVPAGLWGRLDDDQRDAMILHELAHLRRRDHWVRLVELVVTGLYWWHPALWWARRGLHEAEEQCCDAWVVWARPGSARTYATALVEAVEFLSASRPGPLPLGASGMGRIGHISRRITMIMRGKTPRTLSWLGLFTLLALAGLLLPWLPTWGRSPQKTAPIAGVDPDLVRRMADEIELLANGVELKEALLRKAEAQRDIPRAEHVRLKKLSERGVISSEEVSKVAAQVKVAEADVAVAQAELREAVLRLTQARRRLAGLTAAPPEGPAPGPDGGAASKQARRPDEAQSRNNLKQIVLALHNYATEHGHFPPPAITSPEGRPLLSWRVAILPYLDQKALHDRFRLDEPWDSEHNRPLLAMMPEVFADPAIRSEGLTNYLAVVGPTTLWGKPEGVQFSEITDGASNTLSVASAPRRAVSWSEPADLGLPVEADTPMDEAIRMLAAEPSLADLRGGSGFLGAFADGRVRRFGPLADPVLLALLTRDGGEVISADALGDSGHRGGAAPQPGSTIETAAPAGGVVSVPPPLDPKIVDSLKRVGLALHNYHDAHGRFPPPAILGKDGQALLSWRVAILPYLGQQALYEKFHLDEPWDSEHNGALIEEMPDVYPSWGGPSGFARPGSRSRGRTTIAAPVGPETAWDNVEGNPMTAITDGTSNTILAFAATSPIDWTRPADPPYRSTLEYGVLYTDGFPALFADGSVRRVWPDDPAVFHALFTRAGGEVIYADRIDPPASAPRRPYDAPFFGRTPGEARRRGLVRGTGGPAAGGADAGGAPGMGMPGMGAGMGMPGRGMMGAGEEGMGSGRPGEMSKEADARKGALEAQRKSKGQGGGEAGRPGGGRMLGGEGMMSEMMEGGYGGMMGMPGMSGRGMGGSEPNAGMMGMTPGMGGRGMRGSAVVPGSDPSGRIADLEAQVEGLKREIDKLRKQSGPGGEGSDEPPPVKP